MLRFENPAVAKRFVHELQDVKVAYDRGGYPLAVAMPVNTLEPIRLRTHDGSYQDLTHDEIRRLIALCRYALKEVGVSENPSAADAAARAAARACDAAADAYVAYAAEAAREKP